MDLVWLVPVTGVLAVLFALWLARDVLSRDTGTDAMRDVASTIYEGAIAFIRRQYSTIAGLALLGAVVIARSSSSGRVSPSGRPGSSSSATGGRGPR